MNSSWISQYDLGVSTPELDRIRRHFTLLEESQTWERERLDEYRLGKLRTVYSFARRHVPFYAEKFADCPEEITSWEEFNGLPTTLREEAADHPESRRANVLPMGARALRALHTSGSSGLVVESVPTDAAESFRVALSLRELMWHGIDLRASAAVIRALVKDPIQDGALLEGVAVPHWSTGVLSHLVETGPGYFIDVSVPVDRQVEFLKRHRPTYLLVNPSNLDLLSQAFADDPPSEKSIVLIRTLGETLHDDVRSRAESAFECPVVDAYSCQECGHLAAQCGPEGRYHVQEESVILEVIDDEGRPCEPGQPGHVLVTSLLPYATPLIRYKLGDIAEFGSACECGKTLRSLSRIVGREMSLIRKPDGAKVINSTLMNSLSAVDGVRRYQVTQLSPDAFDIQVVCSRQDCENDVKEVFARTLDWPHTVTVRVVEAIPPGPSGKMERFRWVGGS